MNPEDQYKEINRKSWNKKTAVHVASEFYDLKGFLAGRSSLNEIELNLLGGLEGKSVLHLQCHFGQDSISMARLGASVTGVDLSDMAIEKARQLAEQTGANAQFICCDMYDLPGHLSGTFDVVFATYGTIGWLPDMQKWVEVVAHFLKPGGRFVFAEFHPVVWMYDGDFETITYRYFNSGPITSTETGTYADKDAPMEADYVMWNHSISEVLTPLIGQGLTIQKFQEFDYSPYNCFNGMTEIAPGKYRIAHLGDKLPMLYAILATKAAPLAQQTS